jgi:hypothetical protein
LEHDLFRNPVSTFRDHAAGVAATQAIRKIEFSGGRVSTNSFWTKARARRLKSLWVQKKSTRDIAEELGCSKNAVIGKAKRLGFPDVPLAERRRRNSEAMVRAWSDPKIRASIRNGRWGTPAS